MVSGRMQMPQKTGLQPPSTVSANSCAQQGGMEQARKQQATRQRLWRNVYASAGDSCTQACQKAPAAKSPIQAHQVHLTDGRQMSHMSREQDRSADRAALASSGAWQSMLDLGSFSTAVQGNSRALEYRGTVQVGAIPHHALI